MSIKAATDLPGQDQQSDEEDEEIHRAHRLQVLQHSGSARRGRRRGGERGQRDADAAREQSHLGVTLEIMTAAVFQSTVNGQMFPSSLRAFKAEGCFFCCFFSKVPQCREMHPARNQTSAVKQSQAISSPFDSAELLSHPGTENKS